MATTKSTTASKSSAKKAPAKRAPEKAKTVTPDIEIAIEPPKPITVSLGGEIFSVRPIKGALGISLGQRMQSVKGDASKLQDTIEHIVQMIFGPKTAPAVLARLDDPADALDFTHIMNLMNALVERSTGSPTT